MERGEAHWEKAVASALTALTGIPDPTAVADTYLAVEPEPPPQVVFRVHLGLTALDLTDRASAAAITGAISTDLARSADAYAIRDAQNHPSMPALSEELTALLDASGLDGTVPAALTERLAAAVTTAETTLRRALTHPR